MSLTEWWLSRKYFRFRNNIFLSTCLFRKKYTYHLPTQAYLLLKDYSSNSSFFLLLSCSFWWALSSKSRRDIDDFVEFIGRRHKTKAIPFNTEFPVAKLEMCISLPGQTLCFLHSWLHYKHFLKRRKPTKVLLKKYVNKFSDHFKKICQEVMQT